MSESNEVQEMYQKWYGRFVIVTTLLIIVAVASLGANIFMFVGYSNVVNQQQELVDRYDDTIKTMQEYDIRVELNITWLDYSEEIFSIRQLGSPIPRWNNDSIIDHWNYNFFTSEIDINTTDNAFRWIYLDIYMPIKAYDIFSGINCVWLIEDHEGNRDKDDFDDCGCSGYFYKTQVDISPYMWKEIVPNEVEVKITLTI